MLRPWSKAESLVLMNKGKYGTKMEERCKGMHGCEWRAITDK